jgi:hypothetical protein
MSEPQPRREPLPPPLSPKSPVRWIASRLPPRPRLRVPLERFHKSCELLSFIALIIGAPVAVFDLHVHEAESAENSKKERVEAASKLYRDVDQRYVEFMKICLEHPRLDCYSVSLSGLQPPLSETEKLQQKILYSALTDVFEVAYVEYNRREVTDEVRKFYKAQWGGWDSYIKKFLRRPAYRKTWLEIRDEYDEGLVAYMDGIAFPAKRQPGDRQR